MEASSGLVLREAPGIIQVGPGYSFDRGSFFSGFSCLCVMRNERCALSSFRCR